MSGRRSTPHTPRNRALFRRLTRSTPSEPERTPSRRIDFDESTPPVSSIRRTPKRSSRRVMFTGHRQGQSPKSPNVSNIEVPPTPRAPPLDETVLNAKTTRFKTPVKTKYTKEQLINSLTERTKKYVTSKKKTLEKHKVALSSIHNYEDFLKNALEGRLDAKYIWDYMKARKNVMKDSVSSAAAHELRDFFSQNYENFDPIHLAARHSFRAAHGLSEYDDSYLNDLMLEAGYQKGEEGLFMADVRKYYDNYLGDIELLQLPWEERKERIKDLDELYRYDDYITDATYDLPVEDTETRNQILTYALDNVSDYMRAKYLEDKYRNKLAKLSEEGHKYSADLEQLENVKALGVNNDGAVVDIGQHNPYIGMQTSVGQIGSIWGADSQFIGPPTAKYRYIKTGFGSSAAEPAWMEQALNIRAPLYRLFTPGGFSA